jgi:hypothetical protein
MAGDYHRGHRPSTFSIEQHVDFYDEALVGHEVSGHRPWFNELQLTPANPVSEQPKTHAMTGES